MRKLNPNDGYFMYRYEINSKNAIHNILKIHVCNIFWNSIFNLLLVDHVYKYVYVIKVLVEERFQARDYHLLKISSTSELSYSMSNICKRTCIN